MTFNLNKLLHTTIVLMLVEKEKKIDTGMQQMRLDFFISMPICCKENELHLNIIPRCRASLEERVECKEG